MLVILVRHGESEGNVDKKMWWKKPDHTIELTEKGKQQACCRCRKTNRVESILRACDDEEEEEEGTNSAIHTW